MVKKESAPIPEDALDKSLLPLNIIDLDPINGIGNSYQ